MKPKQVQRAKRRDGQAVGCNTGYVPSKGKSFVKARTC